MFVLRVKAGEHQGKFAVTKRFNPYRAVSCTTNADINKAKIFKTKNGITTFFGTKYKSPEDYVLYGADLRRYAQEHNLANEYRIPQTIRREILAKYTYSLEDIYDVIPVEIKIKQQ